MGSEIAPDARLDCVRFRILSQNRYDACIYSGDEEEIVASGLVDQLLVHLPLFKGSYSEGTSALLKLQLPQNVGDATWLTKSTLLRFFRVIDSPDALEKAIAINSELSQLQEAREFHLSLYTQGQADKLASGLADNFNSKDLVSKPEAANSVLSSDASKNELVRAMDLRLTTLKDELASAFKLAAQASFSIGEMLDLEKFCEHFGAVDLRKLLAKLIETKQRAQASVLDNKKSLFKHNLKNDGMNLTDRETQVSQPSHSVKPVIFGASPAKAAEIERQSSSESETSFSDEEDRPTMERSRSVVRSATPRRSASPMRRVQIGRSGSRRAPALAIRSLSYFPARERTNDGEAEESEQTNRKTEYNVTRMSVQDAISLFESKQKDQKTDVQKRSSLTFSSANANSKFVLRRWSAGMGESSVESLTQTAAENIVPASSSDPIEDTLNPKRELEAVSNPTSGEVEPAEAVNDCKEPETCGRSSSNPNEANITVPGEEETKEGLDQTEWNRQKEAELNQMLMKLVESKPVRHQNKEPDKRKNSDPRPQQRGGFYNHYKERRDEKLRENVGKKAEKQEQFKTMQKILDKTKAEMSSRTSIDGVKKQSPNKTQKAVKSVPPVSNSRKESPKPAPQKKALPKASPLPATRKSWPSTPSPRTAGASPAKTPTPVHSSGSAASRQKPQASSSVSRPGTKAEKSQSQQKDVKKTQVDSRKSLKSVGENKRQVTPKGAKITKTKGLSSSEDNAAALPAKPGLRSKMTKRSSVVPLEPKPSTRKASGISPSNSPSVNMKKVTLQAAEPVSRSEAPVLVQEDEVVASIPDTVIQQVDRSPVTTEICNADLEAENQVNIHTNDGEEVSFGEACAEGEETIFRMETSQVELQPQEEPIISPSCWVENDQQDLPIPSCNNASQLASPANTSEIPPSSARVRHSLSQMLLEESSEADISEWGIAENPPSISYQKDAPKGLKRLLKFARKSKGDTNVTGWSSPCNSEGEDDGDECRGPMKRSSDNLLRKAALNAKKYGQQGSSIEAFERNFSDSEPPSARSNTSSSSNLSSNKFHESHVSVASSTKASRSFFSLSAFRGNKATDARLR